MVMHEVRVVLTGIVPGFDAIRDIGEMREHMDSNQLLDTSSLIKIYFWSGLNTVLWIGLAVVVYKSIKKHKKSE